MKKFTYGDYMLHCEPVRSEGNGHSFHHRQNRHCRLCSWHSAVSKFSPLSECAQYVPWCWVDAEWAVCSKVAHLHCKDVGVPENTVWHTNHEVTICLRTMPKHIGDLRIYAHRDLSKKRILVSQFSSYITSPSCSKNILTFSFPSVVWMPTGVC